MRPICGVQLLSLHKIEDWFGTTVNCVRAEMFFPLGYEASELTNGKKQVNQWLMVSVDKENTETCNSVPEISKRGFHNNIVYQ